MRTCLVHIGTHKTGTTSLQVLVEQNRATLQEAGLLITRTARPSFAQTGNHQLGWDLLVHGESRDLPLLTQELRASPVDAALVTSEDICLIYSRPATIQMLADAIRAAGYAGKVVIYLRPQAPYAESMYVERIKHDYIRPLSGYIDRILQTGMYVPDGSPIQIEFRYPRLLEPWVRVFGPENVIIRAYEAGQPNEFIFQDFLRLIALAAPGFGRSPLQLSVSHPRANESLTFGTLLDTAYQKLLPQGVPQAEPRALLRTHVPSFSEALLNERFALFSRDETLSLLRAFAPDNEVLARDYGVNLAFRTENDVPPAGDPVWEKAAVERAIFDRLLQLWMETRDALSSQ
ncbi:MAG TPA: hypothetical protein VMF11_09715 [Candidatus Baltobacteraceae bacterium]|nr:hypothetical protein [Candidatus Baltobacteraceae bacterium]